VVFLRFSMEICSSLVLASKSDVHSDILTEVGLVSQKARKNVCKDQLIPPSMILRPADSRGDF
jgi:hypothetical protein